MATAGSPSLPPPPHRTTLLNHISTADHGKHIAAIENEYGEVDIDGSLVAAKATGAEDIAMLNNGYLCCTVGCDLVRMIGELVERKKGKFNHIVIETTDFKNLQLPEIYGGGLTDAGIKNIKDLTSLLLLNMPQNCNLTDKTLELISGLTGLVSLNDSNSHITNSGLRHLEPLKSLQSLTLESCKVTANDIKKL